MDVARLLHEPPALRWLNSFLPLRSVSFPVVLVDRKPVWNAVERNPLTDEFVCMFWSSRAGEFSIMPFHLQGCLGSYSPGSFSQQIFPAG